jgi:heat shock protein HtpX
MTRVLLFLGTNLAVLLVLGIVMELLGLRGILDSQGVGIDVNALLVISAVVGMTGSFISLAMSKWIALRTTGAQVIKQPQTADEQWLFDTVARQAREAGIGMPDVAVYDAPDMNAFATGMNRNSALVAVSTGLLR